MLKGEYDMGVEQTLVIYGGLIGHRYNSIVRFC